MMKAIIFNIFILVLLTGCNDGDNDLNKLVDFETIERDFYSGEDTPQNVIVNNINEWEDLWEKTVNWTPDELPSVNFGESMVLAVYMGEKTSGGFNVEILEVKETEELIIVVTKFTNPETEQGLTTALTQPFHMIKIGKTDKEIIFSELH